MTGWRRRRRCRHTSVHRARCGPPCTPELPAAPTIEDYLSRAGRLALPRAAVTGGTTALAARPDPVAGRRLERLRRPAPEPRAAGLRRAGRRRHAGRRRRPTWSDTSARITSAASPGCCAIAWRTGRSPIPRTACSSWPRCSTAAGARRWRPRPGIRRWRICCAAAPPRAGGAGRGPRTACSRACAVRAPIYAAIVREKLSWIGVPSQALLLAHGDPRRVPRSCTRTICSCSACRRSTTWSTRSRIARCAAAMFHRALLLAGRAGAGGAQAGAAGGGRRRGRRLQLVRELAGRVRGRDRLLAPRRRSAWATSWTRSASRARSRRPC